MTTILATHVGEFFRQVSTWPTSKLLAVSAISGVTSHVVFFVHGELDRAAKQILFGLLLTPASILAIFISLGIPILEASATTATIWTSFLSGLAISILTYRLFFHPLRNFPGPVLARTTKWWGALKTAGSLQNHYLVRDLHQKHGDFVRIGPNELSISSEAAVAIVTKCDKGPWYNIGRPVSGTQLTRSRETHKIRRRIWDRAFTEDAVRQYLPAVILRSSQLLSLLPTTGPVNITEYFNYYMWDSMGDLGFTKSFGMLPAHGKLEQKENKQDKYMRITVASQVGVAIFGHVPYMISILDLIPFLNREYKEFVAWCEQLVVERKQRDPEVKDIFSCVLAAEETNRGIGAVDLGTEARLAIIAGSDTTAATLANIFFYTARDKDVQKKLREEVDALYSAFDGDEEKLFKALSFGGCPGTQHLDGVIREALRIHTVLPGSPQRMAPPEGLTIDGTYVPGGAAIYLSLFTTARDPRYFEKPTEFIPERWYEPEKYPLTHKQKVFIPFWTGTWSCVGKPYAYMQLRIVTVRMIRKFSLALAEGTDEDKLFREARDMLVLYMGKIELLLTERNTE